MTGPITLDALLVQVNTEPQTIRIDASGKSQLDREIQTLASVVLQPNEEAAIRLHNLNAKLIGAQQVNRVNERNYWNQSHGFFTRLGMWIKFLLSFSSWR